MSKESHFKFATQELPALELNSWQNGNRCYVRTALVGIVSAVHIQFSGDNTGEGHQPKYNQAEPAWAAKGSSYQEITKDSQGSWASRCVLCQTLYGFESTSTLILQIRRQAQKDKNLPSHPAAQTTGLSNVKVYAVFHRRESLVESMTQASTTGSK